MRGLCHAGCMTSPQQPALLPSLHVPGIEDSIRLYESAFGFKISDGPMRDENNAINYVEMALEGAEIMLFPEGAWGSKARSPRTMNTGEQGIGLYIYVADVDAHHAIAARESAMRIHHPPQDMFWGDRMYGVTCHNGYHWGFATRLRQE
jgi:uncharacterized glyoxalase superfamily protein PhnB